MSRLQVAHVVRGKVRDGEVDEHAVSGGSVFVTPALDLDELVWPRSEPFPARDLSLDEVLDFLAATGSALRADRNGHVADALDKLAEVNPVGGGMLRRHMESAVGLFERDLMRFEYEQALGAYDSGWHRVSTPTGSEFERRWFPTRTVHIMAGNTPHGGPQAIVRTALIGGVALLKMPSNDPFTAVAILRTMAELDPDHPLVSSFTAVYWRGGDAEVESVLFRSQFFDKLIAWGGPGAINNAAGYIGPGLELVSFDPKTSISIVGREAFDQGGLAEVARLAANDVRYQEGCSTSRHQYVEGTVEEVDEYCEQLLEAMHAYHEDVQGTFEPTPPEIVSEVDALRHLEPDYRVWGEVDGSGLVVRSDEEPVDFYPDRRTVNVVRVARVEDAVGHVNVATQTVGVYPVDRKVQLRDGLAAGGVDRVADLGAASSGDTGGFGLPHDGMIALHRFVRWIFSHPTPSPEGDRS